MNKNYVILPELRDLIPPQSSDEFARLKELIAKDGKCRQSGIVGIIDGKRYLLDGHHRERICRELGIHFPIETVEFKSIDDAKIWMLENQLARRNLNDFQRTEAALKLKPLLAERAKERQRGGQGGALLCPNLHKAANTLGTVAEQAGVSRSTVHSVQTVIKNAVPDVLAKARSGEISTHTAVQISKLAPALQREIAALPDSKTIITATKLARPKRDKYIFANLTEGPFFANFRFLNDGTLINIEEVLFKVRKLLEKTNGNVPETKTPAQLAS